MWWLVLIVFALLIPEILSTILDSRLGRAIAAQVERRGGREEPEHLAERIRHLEGEVDRLSVQVRRLLQESEFLQELLSDRASDRSQPRDPGPPPLPPGERTS